MSKIELLNKKVLENLKQVSAPGGSLDSDLRQAPNHAMIDFKHIEEMKEEANKDKNTDKKDV